MAQYTYAPAILPCGPAQTVTYTGSAVQSTASFPPSTGALYVWATTAAFVQPSNGTVTQLATNQSIPLAPNMPVVIPVQPGFNDGQMKISAIQAATTSGLLFALPVQAQ